MNIYDLRVQRYSELLFVVQDIIARKVDYSDVLEDMNELIRIGEEFKMRREDSEVKLLGVKTITLTKELRTFNDLASRYKPTGRIVQKQMKSMLKTIRTVNGLIRNIEGRGLDVI
ncbi:hypothetical protein CN514_05590 [Bacillus sp. AFS001701]|uniref:hypothetical protein n=1 Tax=Bacillus sp. AFS001701 TaxID=2033480 RepID=UPI000BFA7F0E|nr:hypothetical protein [Bacillus sp. AFS001701]PET71850.1 hypothetical protein CN514_05590 [Bacillus sp. AFS001701]